MPGLQGPAEFTPRPAKLLGLQDLWNVARQAPPALLFRIRTEAGMPGGDVTPVDRLESCIGMVDSVVRWRAAFRMAGIALSGVREPELLKVCTDALRFISTQHPSMISQPDRRQMLEAIATSAQRDEVNGFEQRVAGGIARVTQAESDYDVAHVTPFVDAFMPFAPGSEEEIGRLATIETLAGATLINEAQMRLSERAPSWMFASMPSLAQPMPSNPTIGPRRDDEEQDDDSDGL